jgi:aryl-alcohol dehydrogenase-like predicted oxidoreductase
MGSADLQVGLLGMGCWQFGGGSYWGPQSQKDVDEVVHKALDLGVNYFDTAEVYNDGDSEISLGLALKGRRHEAVIGSKISTANTVPSVLREHCEASLRRMQTDYIDLYMLHWPLNPLSVKHYTSDEKLISSPPTVAEVFGALTDLQREGKIRYIGVSNHGVAQMKEVQATGATFIANELCYNLVSRAIEDSILPYCIEHQIGLIGYMPLQQGLLTGKYPTLDDVKPMLARTRHFHHSRGTGSRHGEEGAEAEINAALPQIQKIADELGVHIAELSLAWSVANEAMTTTIVGSRNLEQLIQNMKGAELELSDDVVKALNDITQPVLDKLGTNPDYFENRYNSRVSS